MVMRGFVALERDFGLRGLRWPVNDRSKRRMERMSPPRDARRSEAGVLGGEEADEDEK